MSAFCRTAGFPVEEKVALGGFNAVNPVPALQQDLAPPGTKETAAPRCLLPETADFTQDA